MSRICAARLRRADRRLLLTASDRLPSSTSGYLQGRGSSLGSVELYGGSAAVGEAVRLALVAATA
jgi:hypothetical protein